MLKEKISIAQLGGITAYDMDSTAVNLSELWKEKIAVLVFIRHFG